MFGSSMAICELDGDRMDCYNDRRNNVNPIFPSINTTYVSDVVFSNQGNVPWNIRTLSKATFTNAPLCNSLDARAIGLRNIECDALNYFQSELKYLHLDENMLSVVPSCALYSLSKLKELTLSSNAITYMSSDVRLPPISVLDLSNNYIRHFDYNDTETMFQKLILTQNRLDLMPTLRRVPFLKYLDLSSNFINNVNINNFETNRELQFINLDNNTIKQITWKDSKPLKQLHTLILSRNYIQYINESVFLGMLNLTIIDLSNNFLSDLGTFDFTENINLKFISLASNRIKSAYMLLDNCNKCILDLSSNKLETISWSNTSNILSLDISSNLFTNIPFIPITLEYFDISYNPLTSVQISQFLTNMYPMGLMVMIAFGLFCNNVAVSSGNAIPSNGITLDWNICVPPMVLCMLKRKDELGFLVLYVDDNEVYSLPECGHNVRVRILSLHNTTMKNIINQMCIQFDNFHKLRYSSKCERGGKFVIAEHSEQLENQNLTSEFDRTLDDKIHLGIVVVPIFVMTNIFLTLFLWYRKMPLKRFDTYAKVEVRCIINYMLLKIKIYTEPHIFVHP